MFDLLIRGSVRHRLFVLLAATLLLVAGGLRAAGIPVDVFPDLNRPTVTLLTEAGGLSPEEVELLVTRPLEAGMNGAGGVERVRSQSAAGLSVVWVEFGWDKPPREARQEVAERLAVAAEGLPDGVVPVMAPQSSIMGEILLVGISSPDGTVAPPALRTLGDWTLRPRLMAIPGVSQVTALGGGVEILEVAVWPDRLARLGIPIEAVRDAVADAQGAGTGGFLERKSQEYTIRVLARSADPERLSQAIVARVEGVPIPLSQVAEVTRSIAPPRGDAGVGGHPGVVLAVSKQPGADTLALTESIGGALDDLRATLPAGVEVTTLFRQADFIDAAVGNVEEALRDGALLVVIVLVVFLGNVRTTLITLTAIPLSLVLASLALAAMGLTINTMTLGGLAIALGELVDDAIVDVENVYRRLRERRGEGVFAVIAEASAEVRNSIVFSTLLVVLVFVPLFALSGVEGRLFAPLGVAYIASIGASMLVSLTVTPALCAYLLPGLAAKAEGDGRLVRALKRLEERVLDAALPRPGPVLAVTAALVVTAAASLPLLGTSFLPPFSEGTATINVLAAPGTSLGESNRLGQAAERLVLGVPEVATVGRRTGRAELDEHAEGVHYSEIDVDFREEGRPRPVVLDDIRARLSTLPGVAVSLGQPIGHRLDHLLSGVRAQIAVKVFGPDLAALRDAQARVEAAMRPVAGVVDLRAEPQVLVPQVHVTVDADAARRFGVAPGRVAHELEVALAGETVDRLLDGTRTLDLVVRYAAHWRDDVERLRMAPVVLEDRVVTLGQLADVRLGTGPDQILREDGQRRVVVSANVAGRDVGSVVEELTAVLRTIPLPPESWLTIDGQYRSQIDATRRIALLSVGSLLAMYAVLYAHLRAHALVLQVLLNLPLALIGAVASIHLSGQPLSVASLVGFVTLTGIASRNTILMISHYLHLHRVEGVPFGRALVVRGTLERLVPVSMTALCAGIGLVPLAFAGDSPGKEILTPVAQVILGGLFSSTLLDMIVTPTLFLRLGGALLGPPATSDPTEPR